MMTDVKMEFRTSAEALNCVVKTNELCLDRGKKKDSMIFTYRQNAEPMYRILHENEYHKSAKMRKELNAWMNRTKYEVVHLFMSIMNKQSNNHSHL